MKLIMNSLSGPSKDSPHLTYEVKWDNRQQSVLKKEELHRHKGGKDYYLFSSPSLY